MHTSSGGRRIRNATAVRTESGSPAPRARLASTIIVSCGITAQAEQRARECESRFRHLTDAAPIASSLAVMRSVGTDNPLVAKSRAIIERQFHNLHRMVNDLLDVARIANGKISISRERIALNSVVEQAVEAVCASFEALDHQLEISLPGSPMHVDGDAARLAQAIANVLDNAAKFTPQPDVIKLSAGVSGGAAFVTVRDRGCGSAFTMCLPASADTPHAPAEEPSGGAHAADKHGFRILLIDDSRDAAESMSSLLSLMNYDVRTALTAQTGLELAVRFEPQLILCDIGLPDMDGYQLAPALRKAAGSRRMVLAAASGYGMASDRARSLAAGFDYHLVKPIDADALLKFVAQQAASF